MTRSRGAAAFKRSLTDRLKKESQIRGRPFEHLRREFYLQRFLARVFSQPEGRWLLKGGASLLVRLPDARYSQDIDLLHTAAGLEEAVEDLRAAADLSELDPLSFVIRDEPVAMTGGVDGAKLKVEGYYDALYLFSFPIGLSTELVAVGDVDYQSPRPIVAMEGLAAMPEFALYPLPAQIADKVCAMYGRYGRDGGPSTRYHDLVDLVLIISAWRFAADVLARGLSQESERRGLTPSTSLLVFGCYIALMGIGLGLVMQILILIVQNTFPAAGVAGRYVGAFGGVVCRLRSDRSDGLGVAWWVGDSGFGVGGGRALS